MSSTWQKAINALRFANKTKRPSKTPFKQQLLPAWKPMLTAKNVIPVIFLIGASFLPIGIGMIFIGNSVREKIIPYTDCKNEKGDLCKEIMNITVGMKGEHKSYNTKIWTHECICNVTFEIEEDWVGNVVVHYGLKNYFQGHRRYVKSRDDSQLLGNLEIDKNEFFTEHDCNPYLTCETKEDCCNEFQDGECTKPVPIGTIYLPCGAIANSMFNDEVSIWYQQKKLNLIRTDIAWPMDKSLKFSNPEECKTKTNYTDCLKEKFSVYAKPKYWKKNLWELDITNPDNNGLQNEDLIVWMRTAAFPNFRKPYRKINHSDASNLALSKQFGAGVPKGKYSLLIDYNFDVQGFSGEKEIILSTTNIFGGKNSFLGIAYTIVGLICLLLGIVLVITHKYQGKLLESDPDMLSALAAAHAPEIHTPKILLDVTTNTLRVPQNNYFLPDDEILQY